MRQELELRALPNFELGMAGAAGELAGLGRVSMRHVRDIILVSWLHGLPPLSDPNILPERVPGSTRSRGTRTCRKALN